MGVGVWVLVFSIKLRNYRVRYRFWLIVGLGFRDSEGGLSRSYMFRVGGLVGKVDFRVIVLV